MGFPRIALGQASQATGAEIGVIGKPQTGHRKGLPTRRPNEVKHIVLDQTSMELASGRQATQKNRRRSLRAENEKGWRN